MKKFVLIDPSIKQQGGHYLEYADRVLDAAKNSGFETLLVSNKTFAANSHLSRHPVKAWFHRDFFESSFTFARHVKKQLRAIKKVLKSAAWFLLKLVILNRLFTGLLLRLMGTQTADEISASKSHFFRRLLAAVKHNKIFRLFFRLSVKIAKVLAAIIVVLAGSPFLAVFLAAMLVSYAWQSAIKPGFASGLKRLLSKKVLEPGDLVFIPTAGLVELKALNLVLKKFPLAQKLRWKILFRRDLVEGRRVSSLTAAKRQAVFRPWRKILSSIRQLGFQTDISFFTDTDELTADYNALGVYFIKTAVIPVAPELHVRQTPTKPLTALYLGDARDEKGFHLLPALMRQTLDLIKSKGLRYVCQSNFNIPGGERESSRALTMLRETQVETSVQLIPGPLTASEYHRLIQSAGIIMVPYKPENYQARSSGIFAEALAAGIPCLVPAGTSMARQAEKFRQEYFRHLSGSDAVSVLATFKVSIGKLLSGYAFSSSTHSSSKEKPSSGRKYVKISWPISFYGSQFLRVEIKNYDSKHAYLNSRTQTVALEKGSPGCALIGLDGDMHRLTIGFSPKPENLASGLPIELSLLEAQSSWSRGAGVGIYEDSHDLALCLRDLTDFYGHHRQTMTKISAETWPLFNPERLVSQLSEMGEPLTQAKSNRPKIMFWSDLSVGYGSPQIPSLAESMRQHYQADVSFLAVDENYRPVTRPDFLSDEVKIDYVFTADYPTRRFFSIFKAARYGSQAVEVMEKFKPDILVVTHLSALPYLKNAAHKPAFVILYHLELGGVYQRAIVKTMAHAIDCVVFPEKNRASLELPRLGLDKSKAVPFVMHNSRKFKQQPRQLPSAERNGRFIYAGGFWERTHTRWLLEDKVAKFPIDIFGSGGSYFELFKKSKSVNYYGYIPSDDSFFSLLGKYAYSLILWSPDHDDTYYCAPNKLYDSLVCGVPFISGPHPLCLELVAKYNCGLIMPDWSLESFVETLVRAQKAFKAETYQKMVEGCRQAMVKECDWDLQFSKLAELLPSVVNLQEK